MKEKIILIGGGGHCRSVIDVIECEGRFEIYGIVDVKDKIGKKIFEYEIIGSDEDLYMLFNKVKNALITVGHIYDNSRRVELFKLCEEIGFIMPNVISPFAYVSKYASLGKGNVIMHYAVVNAGAKIGNNCIINTRALIEHDVVVEDHCHISTGAIVNGGTVVRENTFLGSNSVSKEYTEVSGFIKAGSIVK
ncbi:MAG: NeuD/PglB/VioB family sugar acetyltransferase [Thermodesulfovibrio sp.]|nr:NeuD/PglB/VioB family sugar acetyltransferase [Thermodesulfovibrio sp.]MDW7998300.1 NeuD/PglB/VioB family sugar acetyltransferase [Thermodesulfovibrio sp.]